MRPSETGGSGPSAPPTDGATPEGSSPEAAAPGSEPAGSDAPEDSTPEVDPLAELRAERDEYLSALQRVQAEFDNYRKRTAAASKEMVAAGTARIVESLLPVLDACDAAAGHGDESVDAICGQLLSVLVKEGLERIPSVGETFDPEIHEAVLHEPGEGGEQTVVEELRAGYRWGGKVLRAAMVKVRD